MKTKDKLYKLFEYQKFEKNPHLESIIDDVTKQETFELSDDALLAATGGVKVRDGIKVGDKVAVVGEFKEKIVAAIEGSNVIVESEDGQEQEKIPIENIIK